MLGNSSVDTTNGLYCYDTGIASPSDERVKNNVIDNNIGLDFVNSLRPVSYQKAHPSEWPEDIRENRWKRDKKPEDWTPKTEVGLIAQEVKTAITDADLDFQLHNTTSVGVEHLKYNALVVPLVKAVQELSAKVAELEAKA